MLRATVTRALVVLVAALAVVPATSLGAKPVEQFHSHFTESFSEELCGIAVDGTAVVTENVFLYADETFKVTTTGRITFTNPANGQSVILSFAGQISGRAPIVDEAAGTITFVTSFKGLPEKIQTANGRVLLRDAGIIVFAETFDLDTDDFISSEILIQKGPHPDAESDFALFCGVIEGALA